MLTISKPQTTPVLKAWRKMTLIKVITVIVPINNAMNEFSTSSKIFLDLNSCHSFACLSSQYFADDGGSHHFKILAHYFNVILGQ